MLILKLGLLVSEVLLLCFYDHMQLSFLTLHLLYKFLQVGNLLEVLDLLRSDLLVEDMLLLLVPDLILKLSVAMRV